MRLPPIKGPTDMTLPDTVAADATFRLPVATRAAAAAGAPQMAALLDELLGLCGEEPVTAVLAVTEALARRHPTQFATPHALLSRATQTQSVPLQTPRVRGARPVAVTAAAAAPRPKAGPAVVPAPRRSQPAVVPPLNVSAAAAAAAASDSGDAAPPATARASMSKPAVGSPAVTRTPRSLLKSESVVSYLARTTGGGAVAATPRGAAASGAGGAGRSPGMATTTGATPRGAGAGAAAAAAGDGARQRVDVDKWLLERRAREEAREKSKSSKMHKDARFIERLERQQEVRNAGLAAEEDRRRHAAAAAAQWQVQQYKPLQGEGARGAATGEGTSEEQMLRKDAQRLFGHAAAVPQLVAGTKGGALLPEQPREIAVHHGSSRLADVVLKAAAAASIASAGADGHRSLSSRLSGKVGASGGSLRSSVSDTPGSHRGSVDMNVRGSLTGGEEKRNSLGSPKTVVESSPAEEREPEQPAAPAAAEQEAEAPAAAEEAAEEAS